MSRPPFLVCFYALHFWVSDFQILLGYILGWPLTVKLWPGERCKRNCWAARCACAQQFGLGTFAWVMDDYTRHKQTNPFFHVRTRFPFSPLQATLEDTDKFHMIKTRSMYLLRTLPNTLATLIPVSTFRAQPAQLCLKGERANHGSAWQQAFHQEEHSYICYI